jgi:hypothetical protein
VSLDSSLSERGARENLTAVEEAEHVTGDAIQGDTCVLLVV